MPSATKNDPLTPPPASASRRAVLAQLCSVQVNSGVVPAPQVYTGHHGLRESSLVEPSAGAVVRRELAVALAWPAKTFLCSSDTTPEIVCTSETVNARGHESSHSNNQWELVCRSKSGDKRPSGVFWVQIGTWLLLFFPPILLLGYYISRWHKRHFPDSWPD